MKELVAVTRRFWVRRNPDTRTDSKSKTIGESNRIRGVPTRRRHRGSFAFSDTFARKWRAGEHRRNVVYSDGLDTGHDRNYHVHNSYFSSCLSRRCPLPGSEECRLPPVQSRRRRVLTCRTKPTHTHTRLQQRSYKMSLKPRLQWYVCIHDSPRTDATAVESPFVRRPRCACRVIVVAGRGARFPRDGADGRDVHGCRRNYRRRTDGRGEKNKWKN